MKAPRTMEPSRNAAMHRRLFGFLFLLASFLTLTSLTTYFWPVQRISLLPSALELDYEHWMWTNSTNGLPDNQCQLPQISPWHQSLLHLIDHPRQVICRRVQPDLTYLDENGVLHLNNSAVEEFLVQRRMENAQIDCQYSYFDRGRVDREIVFDAEISLKRPVVLQKNFVRVQCYYKNEVTSASKLVYANVHAHPIPVTNANRSLLSKDGDDMNVLLYFVESASSSMVHRHLPSTLRYLTETMDAFVFDSMLKVGENTLPNLAALFTGMRLRNEQETMPLELKQASNNQGFYDHWPFIWRRYREDEGYVTTYLEDDTRLSTFHYSGNGFRAKPVDYWYFPFMEVLRKTELPQKSSKFCFGNRPMYEVFNEIPFRHVMSKDWIERRQFFFTIFSDLSHDYACDLERMDDKMKEFLETMHGRGRLNRTILVIAGDHGPRFTTIRPTEAGFVEERVPFFSVWLPPWFLQRYPHIHTNLKVNQHRLISLFDLHQTLVDILERRFPEDAKMHRPIGRGFSLFHKVPPNRTCFQAGIPDRYCLCHGIQIESPDHPLAVRSAALVLKAAKNVTWKYRTKCAKLKVEKILYFLQLGPNGYSGSGTVKTYFIAFRTQPLGAVFEGAVLHDILNSSLSYQKGTLERISSFGARGRCVPSIQLKKFCACKEDVTRAMNRMDRVFRDHHINLYGNDSGIIFQAMKYFRQLLSRTVTPGATNVTMDPTVKGSMVPRIVELLHRYDNPNIQMEAAWALTNLACGTAVETWMLVALGAAQKLVELVTRSTNADVRDQAVWAISNIAGDSHECREYLLKIGALEAFLVELHRLRYRRHITIVKAQESRRNLVWGLSNLCRSRSSSSFNWQKFSPVVTSIAQLLSVPNNLVDDELVSEACWTLAYLMDGHANWSPVQAVLEAGMVEPMVNLLGNMHMNSNRVLSSVVRALGNIVTGTAEQTQAVLDAGVLSQLHYLLKRENDSLVREICWLLSNITSGTEQQISMVLDCPDLFACLVSMAANHRLSHVRREATWAVCNALSGGDAEQKRRVIGFGCISTLIQTCSTCEDSRLLEALLAAIDIILVMGREQQTNSTFGYNTYANILAEHGGIDVLTRLANDDRWGLAIRMRCLLFISEYFDNGANEDTVADCFKDGPIVIKFKRARQ